MKKIAILGSTGSIGTQTLEVARENGDLQITALAAGNNIELLEKQIREFHPGLVAVWKEEKAKELKDRVKDLDVKIVSGMDGLIEVCTVPEAEIVVDASCTAGPDPDLHAKGLDVMEALQITVLNR